LIIDIDDVGGKKPHDLFPAEIADELHRAYENALEGTANTIRQSYQGEYYRVQTAPVRAEDGSVDQLIAVSQNITESAEKKERLEAQNKRLEEFAHVVSHVLRNPLNVADGQIELARQECDSERLDGASRALGRMETLIEDLLTLAQQGNSIGETTTVSLTELTEQCWQAVETGAATRSIESEYEVQADPKRFQQLSEDLIRNDVEHSSTSPDSQARQDPEARLPSHRSLTLQMTPSNTTARA
jgi:signal transduction histidine kinase